MLSLQYRFGTHPESKKKQTLLSASENGYEADSKLLKAQHVNVADKYGRTLLWLAAGDGNETFVKGLLDTENVKVNVRDKNGETPLWVAAKNGHDTVVKLLLDSKEVEVNAADKQGRTPLWVATLCEHNTVIKLLLDNVVVDVQTAIATIEAIQMIAKRVENNCPAKYEEKLKDSLSHLRMVEDTPGLLTEGVQAQVAILTDLSGKILSQLKATDARPKVSLVFLLSRTLRDISSLYILFSCLDRTTAMLSVLVYKKLYDDTIAMRRTTCMVGQTVNQFHIQSGQKGFRGFGNI